MISLGLTNIIIPSIIIIPITFVAWFLFAVVANCRLPPDVGLPVVPVRNDASADNHVPAEIHDAPVDNDEGQGNFFASSC